MISRSRSPTIRWIATDTVISYPNLTDGIWYFHIKALKQGIWGGTTNFVIRIDTGSPADFTPQSQIITSAGSNQALISFFTTDALSGLDHYEVGVVDTTKSPADSPVFTQTESPYQLPLKPFENVRVTVRAFDKAGNVKDESITVNSPLTWLAFLEQNWLIILLLLLLLFHYFFGHKIFRRVKRILRAAKEEGADEPVIEKKAQKIAEKIEEKKPQPLTEPKLEQKEKPMPIAPAIQEIKAPAPIVPPIIVPPPVPVMPVEPAFKEIKTQTLEEKQEEIKDTY